MKTNLPDVTLIAVDCTDRINGTIAALETCNQWFDFGAVKLVRHIKPENLPDYIEFEECPFIGDINTYNYYMFKRLTEHVATSHCLTVQDHAFIVRPEEWKDEWLYYDYIGAPWAVKEDAYICRDTGEHVRVGNGGFSLRSKELLEIPALFDLPLLEEQGYYNEDGNICVYHRKRMLELGIRYAPIKVAAKFSFENSVEENLGLKTFGFHRTYPKYFTRMDFKNEK